MLNGVHYFLYDGGHVVCELNNSGTPIISYGYGVSGLAERYDASLGVFYAYTFDPSGNVVERHETSTSVPSDWTTLYDAFGASHGAIEVNGMQQSQLVNHDSVGFGGQWGYYTDNELDQATSTTPQGRLAWTLNGLRYYDPATGRFLTRDPKGYEGGINLYSFCGNNPINYADPSGLDNILDNIADLASFIPGAGEVIDAGHAISHAARGNWGEAGLYTVSAIPILHELGDFVKGGKYSLEAFKAFKAIKAVKEVKLIVAAEKVRGLITAARPVAKLTQEALEHIAVRHWATSGAQRAGKFVAGTNIKALSRLIEETAEHGIITADRYNRTRIEYDFGRQIGTDITGSIATRLRLVLDATGKVVTAFPLR